MIEIKGTNINNIECYILNIRKKSFLFFSRLNLSHLKNFTHSSLNIFSQPEKNFQLIKEEEKMDSQNQIADFSKLKVHFDINYLKDIVKSIQSQEDQSTIYLMLAHYQEFLVLPYLIRKFKMSHQIQILSTHIAYQLGRIYVKRIFQRVSYHDLLYSQPQNLSFQQESKLQDEFYLKFGLQIKFWVKLFTREQMEQTFKLVNKINYGEFYDIDGVKIRLLPSGYSLGSALWTFENTITKQKIMFIKQISIQTWRSIAQNHIFSSQKKSEFKQKDFKNIDLLILANGSLISNEQQQKSDSRILNLTKIILQNLQKSVNTEIALSDELLLLDIIDFINFEMRDKFKGIFIENSDFNQIISYANSYVEFLSPQYKQKIYMDPPQYPFESYLILRQKGFLSTGSLYDICQKQKIPLKQLIRKSTPYIHFKPDYEVYLTATKEQDIMFYQEKNCLSPNDLVSLISIILPKKIISFSDILPYIDNQWKQNTGILQYDKLFVINSQPYQHCVTKNISSNIINKYEFVDGFLMAYPVNREFLKFNSAWKEEISKHVRDTFRQVLEVKQNGLRTKSTSLWIQNYEVFIKSSDISEVHLLLQIISSITKTLRLK